jgi:hypothetical protein
LDVIRARYGLKLWRDRAKKTVLLRQVVKKVKSRSTQIPLN